MDAIAALLPLLELAVMSLAIAVWLRGRPRPYPVAAALALGMVTAMGLLSLLLQISFLLHHPEWSPVLELMALGGLIAITWPQRSVLGDMGTRIGTIWQSMPVAMTCLAIACTYLLLQAVLLPPSSWDAMTYHLPRVLLWAQNRSLFLRDFIISPQAAFPVGSDILFHLFLRLSTDYGLGIFSWLSYLTVLLATYGLARPRVSQGIAVTTVVVMGSLPELIYQATATKNDIILAAIALAAVLWADRWLRSPSIESLLGLGLTLCFGVAVKTTFVLFAGCFGVLWLGLVIQQGRWQTLVRGGIQAWPWLALSLLPALILSQCWLFWDNYHQFGDWLGPAKFAQNSRNPDGFVGTIANLARYSFQSIHLLQPVDIVWERLTGWSLTSGLQALYDMLLDPLLGEAGRSQIGSEHPFKITWKPQEDTSWFGPLGPLVIMPAVIWCLARKRGLPRVMAMVACALVLAISYKVGWSPWKSRFFSIVVVLAGLCVAMLLQRLVLRSWPLGCLRALSLVIMAYACLCNVQKPVLLPSLQPTDQVIWPLSQWTRDRLIYDKLRSGDRVEQFLQVVPPGARVAIVGYDHYFPFMFHRQGLDSVLLPAEKTPDGTAQSLTQIADRLTDRDYLLCFLLPCDRRTLPSELEVGLDTVWVTVVGGRPTELYRISP